MRGLIKRLSIIISVLVVILGLSSCSNNKESIQTPVRDVELVEQTIDYQHVLDDFDGGKFKQNGNIVTFEGKKKLNIGQFELIDNLSEDSFESLENTDVLYKFSYDCENDIIALSALLINENGFAEVDMVSGKAFLNDNGEIDAVMDIDGDYVLLSEMKNAGLIENCGWFKKAVKSVVKVAVVTATAVAVTAAIVGTGGAGAIAVIAVVGTVTCAVSTTQTVRANINYSNNKKAKLHSDVTEYGYITDQSKYSDWSFGFATLDDVGCEVIATYNAMVSLGRKKELYDIIYDFEMYNIDYDMGFGHLGSNPKQIFRYLDKHNIDYLSFDDIDSLKTVVELIEDCKIIFSTENDYSVCGVHSIHTFYIERKAEKYYSYNGYIDHGSKDLLDAVEYKFKYAYIVL